MKLLIAPLAAPVETSGPMSRARALAAVALKRGHDVAFCAAEDPNYRPMEHVRNYIAPVPSVFGTPVWIGHWLMRFGKFLGLPQRMPIRSFEQVLYMIGATAKAFFPRDVTAVRHAIQAFRPDVVFAEARIAAIVAARLEQISVVTDYSYPLQPMFAPSPEHSAGVRAYVQQMGLPAVHSVLEIFDWAELKVVPSSYELEPIGGVKVIHVGPLESAAPPAAPSAHPTDILAYVGTGTIAPRRLWRVLSRAFADSCHQLYVASRQLRPSAHGSIQVGPYFDFNALLPRAIAFIHHGGQNSVMAALVHGVPQIIVSGNHFERGYNADSVVRLKAGVKLDPADFTRETIRSCIDQFAADPCYRANALTAGQTLLKLGGAAKVIATLESRLRKARATVA
jgi:UDP:flavonoid glycosyltransferase YjiC (YdhE family)